MINGLYHQPFDKLRANGINQQFLKQTDGQGNEFWLAHQLAKVLKYSQYRHFLPVMERAREACRNSGQAVADPMEDILTMVDIGPGARRKVDDVRLSCYACYLIVQNGDPGKPVIANGQTYFALQTRRFISTVRPELVEGHCRRLVIVAEKNPLMVRQAHHERKPKPAHPEPGERRERNLKPAHPELVEGRERKPKPAHPELVEGLERCVAHHSWNQP